MSACRICLALKPRKNITELSDRKYGGSKSYEEIISFCLGIEVEQDLKVCSKLCTKCYNKVLEFHQFKALALQNESHWKSLNDKVGNSICTVLKDETPKDVIKTENESVGDEDVIDNSFESDALDSGFEVAITYKFKPEEDSDDELLSEMKNIKYEFIQNKEEEENEPVQVKKCRGPAKTTKVLRTKQDKKVGPWKECPKCGKAVRSLLNHMQIHLPPEQRRQFNCDLCDKVYATPKSRYHHRRRAHLSVKQECDICHKNVRFLNKHKLLHKHNPDNMKFVCAICGRKCLCKIYLDAHMATHSKDRPYECDMCGSRFRLKQYMERHKRSIHNREKSHLCHYCSKGFFKLSNLQKHLRSHTKETPYSCAKCNKTFKSSDTLRAHQSIHSEERAFACKLCDMTFARKNYLVAHMKSHLKEKKYPCQYCDVSFHRSDHRKRHEFTAHLKHVALLTAT